MERKQLTELLREFKDGQIVVPEIILEEEGGLNEFQEVGMEIFDLESRDFTIECEIYASRQVRVIPATNEEPGDVEYFNTRIDVDILSMTREDGEVFMTGNQQVEIEKAIMKAIKLL